MDTDETVELEEEVTPEEPEAAVEAAPVEDMPAWDFPTFDDPPPAQQATDPDVFETLKSEAASMGTKQVAGILKNQATLETQLAKQGASADTIMFAKATLLSMDPAMAAKPDAAKIAAMLAIGASAMEGKNWKQPKATQPPPANPVGNPNPVSGNEDDLKEAEKFNRAFADLGISADIFKEIQ